jgi:hypothetical protein
MNRHGNSSLSARAVAVDGSFGQRSRPRQPLAIAASARGKSRSIFAAQPITTKDNAPHNVKESASRFHRLMELL